VEVIDCAFANVDEDANITLASGDETVPLVNDQDKTTFARLLVNVSWTHLNRMCC